MQASIGVNKIYTQMLEFQEIEENIVHTITTLFISPFIPFPPYNLAAIHHFIVYSCMNV